uniref:Uncharacterized protein n=1 Tax=Setaria digitata TaxID=48799 RepID=A0A915Q565_9BILA
MQDRSLGTLVFPTQRSKTIRENPSLLHYGSGYKSGTTSRAGLSRPEERSQQQSRNSTSTSPVAKNLSLSSCFPTVIVTNEVNKLSQSIRSYQQCSKTVDLKKVTANGKGQQNLFREQKTQMSRVHNPPVKAIGTPGTKSKSNRSELLSADILNTATKNASVELKLSNSSIQSEDSKIPENEDISTSVNSSSKFGASSFQIAINELKIQHSKSAKCNSSNRIQSNSTMEERQRKMTEAIIQQQSLADDEQSKNSTRQRRNADGIVKEILDDLDNALESDEQMSSVREMQLHSQKPASGNLSDSPKFSIREYDIVRSAYKSKDNEREYEIKSNRMKTTISISDQLNDQLIQELKQLPKGMMSLKDYKQKQKDLIVEQQKLLEIDIEEARSACTLDKYISLVPQFINGTTEPLPKWRRQILAQKIAREDAQRKEEELRVKFYE